MSIIKVADLAGVSKSTVSRVMNDKPNVSPEAVLRVQAAVKQLDYKPRRLRRRRARPRARVDKRSLAAFALVLPESRGGFYPCLIHGFEVTASENGHQIFTCISNNDVHKQGDIILQLIDKQVAGVAIVPPTVGPSPAHQVRMLQSHRIPTIMLHREVQDVHAPLVELPHRQIGQRAGQEMLAQGHRRVAFIGTTRGLGVERYKAGLREMLEQNGGQLPDELIDLPEELIDNGRGGSHRQREKAVRETLERMLSLPADRQPTAIFSTFDLEAESIYVQLASLGKRVPEDISLVTVGDSWRQGAIIERLATVTVDVAYAGGLAVRLLQEVLQGKRALNDEHRVTTPVDFYLGGTLGPTKLRPVS